MKESAIRTIKLANGDTINYIVEPRLGPAKAGESAFVIAYAWKEIRSKNIVLTYEPNRA